MKTSRSRANFANKDHTTRRRLTGARVTFSSLLAVLLIAPLPLGSARPLAWDILALLVALLLFGFLAFPPAKKVAVTRDLALPGLLFFAVAIFELFQIFPFVPPMLWNPIWVQSEQALGQPFAGSIAIDRHEAFAGILRLVLYGSVFLLAHGFGRDPAFARIGVRSIFVGGAVFGAYGLASYWLGNQTILWLTKWAYQTDLSGTFVNRNSFATFLGICLLAGLCELVLSRKSLHHMDAWRDKLHQWLEFFSARTWLFVCIFIQTTALFLTHSRGGSISTLFGIAAFALALSLTSQLRHARAWGVAVLPILLIGIAFFISGEGVITRWMEAALDAESRFAIFQDTIEAIKDHPLLGTGIGSFTSVFPLYRSEEITSGFVNAAHNDYLECIMELGIPAAFALFLSIASLAALCIRGIWQRRRDAAFPCLGVAISVLVGLHAFVDFSLQIPAVAMTYAFLLGIAVAQSRSSNHGVGVIALS